MSKSCEECDWCVALRGTWGLDCEYYKQSFEDRERAETCPAFERDFSADEEGGEA